MIADDRIFVGSAKCLKNVDALQQSQITHVVNLAGSVDDCPPNVVVHQAHFRDCKDLDEIESLLTPILNFIDNALKQKKNTKVLVQCLAGLYENLFLLIELCLNRSFPFVDIALEIERNVSIAVSCCGIFGIEKESLC